MFANKNKNSKPPRKERDMAQYGIFGLPSNSNTDDMNEDDEDLEAELNALVGDTTQRIKSTQSKKQPVSTDHLNAMIAESMRDIPDDVSDDGDDDDPDLLNELHEIAGEEHPVESVPDIRRSSAPSDIGKILEDRLKMYETAETNARTSGETSRARRYGRAIKTLKDLIKQVNTGKPIAEADIPPEVSVNAHKPAENSVTPENSNASRPEGPTIDTFVSPKNDTLEEKTLQEPKEIAEENQQNAKLLEVLRTRKEQYKIVALKHKKLGDKTTAIAYIKISKQFESVIQAVESGQPVDLSRMPGPPTDPPERQEESETQKNESSDPQPVEQEPTEKENLVLASSVEEALLQRLEVYKKQVQSATEEGNSSKARRMGRVVKQFEDALKLHRAGKPVPVEELPTPPGYGPILVDGGAEKPPPVPLRPSKPKAEPHPEPNEGSANVSGKTSASSRIEQQVTMLFAKQKEFKIAALKAKQKGEINQAKEYLRIAKGFDPLIDAARGGFPVDLSSLPVSPAAKSQLDDDYDVVMSEECSDENSEHFNLISRLEAQLTKQLKTCLATRDHHKALGDVASTNRFEQLALNVTRDLDIIRLARQTPGCKIPKFHYEDKDFSIVKSFTDLGDDDLELVIVRGINYRSTNPTEIDTYVKFEFPFPQEQPYRDKTALVKDTNNPEYNSTFTIPIQRTSRTCQRVFKRHGIKFEVYSKGGFFRGDTLLGTATVKLQQLETDCELHDSFDLMEGRKKAGGKLEIRIRIRHPIIAKKIENMHEKWLVLDS